MAWIGSACTIAAMRFARAPVALDGIDDVHFFGPIHVGDRAVLKAQVNRSFVSYVEVGCRHERLQLNGEATHALSAYLIFKLRGA